MNWDAIRKVIGLTLSGLVVIETYMLYNHNVSQEVSQTFEQRTCLAASKVLLQKMVLPRYFPEHYVERKKGSEVITNHLKWMRRAVAGPGIVQNRTIGITGTKGVGKTTLTIGTLREEPGAVFCSLTGNENKQTLIERLLRLYDYKPGVGEDASTALELVLLESRRQAEEVIKNRNAKRSDELEKVDFQAKLLPVIVVDIDVTITKEQMIDLLAFAKYFGTMMHLAHFFFVFSTAVVCMDFDLLLNRCVAATIDEPSAEEMKEHFGDVLRQVHVPLNEEESKKLKDKVVDCLGLNFLDYNGLVQKINDGHGRPSDFKDICEILEHLKVDLENTYTKSLEVCLTKLQFDNRNTKQVGLLAALADDQHVPLQKFLTVFGKTFSEVITASKNSPDRHPFVFENGTFDMRVSSSSMRKAIKRKLPK